VARLFGFWSLAATRERAPGVPALAKKKASTKRSGGARTTKKKMRSSKRVTKRSAAKGTGAKSSSKKKSSSKRSSSKKKTTRKPASKKTSTKKKSTGAASRSSRKKFGSRKTTKKAGAKKKAPAKKKSSAKKPSAKQPSSKKKAAPKKTSANKTSSKKSASKKTSSKKGNSKAPTGAQKNGEPPRIVREIGSLTDARAAASRLAAAAGLPTLKLRSLPGEEAYKEEPRLKKSPLTKRELDKFRKILLLKRAQVAGDVTDMELEALGGGKDTLSSLPQHMADQGSDAYDQSLSLGLAASQRELLREIDEALERIENRTYGICEALGTAINKDRLEATPWSRYSVEGARRVDRGHGRS